MNRVDELTDDFVKLGSKLLEVVSALGDPDSKLNGSDAAAIVRERRSLGQEIGSVDFGFTRAAHLRDDYDVLLDALAWSSGSSAAVVVRERRLVSELLEQLESPEELTVIDRLAGERSASGDPRVASRRRQSR